MIDAHEIYKKKQIHSSQSSKLVEAAFISSNRNGSFVWNSTFIRSCLYLLRIWLAISSSETQNFEVLEAKSSCIMVFKVLKWYSVQNERSADEKSANYFKLHNLID